MIKPVSNWNFEKQKSRAWYLIFIMLVIAISFVFVGCEQPKKKYQLETICEGGYFYDYIPYQMKKIQENPDGSLKDCIKGRIIRKDLND